MSRRVNNDMQMSLFSAPPATSPPDLATTDEVARERSIDPSRSILLRAPAGSGKTTVLTQRLLKLLARVDAPEEILAITFTRKAAAEMRQRVMATLRQRHREGSLTPARWREIRDAFNDISISTIDAFCLSLLHEFPLEAGVDPGFEEPDVAIDEHARLAGAGRRFERDVAERIDRQPARTRVRCFNRLDRRCPEIEPWLISHLCLLRPWCRRFPRRRRDCGTPPRTRTSCRGSSFQAATGNGPRRCCRVPQRVDGRLRS